MAEPIQFFVEPIKNVDQQAYLDYRDRLASMKQKDISNPKKMAGMKKAVMGKFDLEADEMEDILDEYNPKKIDPTDPKTWMKFDDGRVDIGRSLLVEDSAALAEETSIYRKQAQALGNETLGVIESQVSTYPTRVLGQAGIDPSKTTVNNPVYRDNYKRTMSSIYQDVIDGIDPMDAFDRHLDTLGLPKEFGDHLFKQTESITEMMRSGAATTEAVPYPKVTQDVIDSFTDKPVYFPADDIPTPTSVNLEPTSRLRGTLASVATSTDLSTLSDEELAASKARVEKELMDLEVESKKTEETIAELKKRSGTGKPENKVTSPAYQTTDDLIKDFTTKASSSQADEAGTILKDIFDKTDFANKQFDIPGSTRLVTGSDVLGKLSGIEMTDQIGSVAAYNPESRKMLVNSNLLGSLQPNEIATTFTHELFHTAADASGSLDSEKLTRATSARSAMTLEDAKYLGEQEGIADSFSKRTNARSWLYPRG